MFVDLMAYSGRDMTVGSDDSEPNRVRFRDIESSDFNMVSES